ncbi:MAG: LuxR C-terminal-related transcriptional regulator [Gammaproteobacteria bacterium]|nr:LuxR C-terminal-related transcriptional regulator [Gammaproteobacteria bacterium]
MLFRAVDGVFVVDSQQRIVFWNPGCDQLFGRTSADVMGKRCCEVVRGKDPAGQPFCGGSCCVARLSLGENAPGAFPLRVQDAQGQELRYAVSIVLVPSLRQDQWYCVHLLRRGEAIDPLAIIQHEADPNPNIGTHRRAPDRGLSVLSVREKEILSLLAEGLQVAGISRLLNIRPVTVRNHVQHIQSKLGVHSQAGTVAYAYRHNLV